MVRLTRIGIFGPTLGLAAAAAIMVTPAHAAPDDTQFSVTAGLLSMTAPDVPTLPALTLTGAAQTKNATMSNWTVVDATGSGAGWNLTYQGDAGATKSPVLKEYCATINVTTCLALGYVTGGLTLAANSLTLTSTGATFTAQSGTTGTAPTHSCATACNIDSASAVKIGAAAVNAGMGTYQANSYSATSLALAAPTTIKALGADKVYRVDLTSTLASAP